MKGTLKLRTASLAAAAVMAAGLFAALPAAAETSTPETAQEDSGVPYDVANGLENSFRYKDGVPIYDDSVPAIEWEDIVQQDAATYSSNGIATCSVTYNGFDVSFHQGTVDWDAVKNSGIDFVMIRCGIGSEYDGVGENKQDDAQWYRNVSECERLGIPYGVYLYSYAENTDMAASEARHTLSLLSGHNPTLPVFLDIEHTRNGNPIASNSTYGDIAQTWCNMVSNAGYRVGIYSYYYFFQNYLTDSRFSNSGWYKWMADYRSGVSYDGSSCNMWQYSNKGTVPGVNANVDLNYWFGEYPGNNNNYTGWRSENGRDYWYENGVKQGTTGRGKEIYDSGSNAWYWLDANQGGAKAVNKDVYQESNGGKWVRYDANGHMVKGEDCQNGKWYYFEPVTGAMIKGPWTLPDGRKVYYDPKTGIMQYGSVAVNNQLYYFDPVYGKMTSGTPGNFWYTIDGKVCLANYNAPQLYFLQYSNLGKKFDVAVDPALKLYNEYNSGSMGAIVFQEMRESRGLAYSAWAGIVTGGKVIYPYTVQTQIATQNDKMMDAIKTFNDIINNMPESEAAFKLAKEGIISRLRTDRIIKDNILWSYIYAQDMGMNVDKRIKQYNDVQKMTLQDVIGFQKKWMKDRTYTYCILGDKKELDMEALKTIAPIEELTQEEIFGY